MLKFKFINLLMSNFENQIRMNSKITHVTVQNVLWILYWCDLVIYAIHSIHANIIFMEFSFGHIDRFFRSWFAFVCIWCVCFKFNIIELLDHNLISYTNTHKHWIHHIFSLTNKFTSTIISLQIIITLFSRTYNFDNSQTIALISMHTRTHVQTKVNALDLFIFICHKFIYWNRLELRVECIDWKFNFTWFDLTVGWNKTGEFENTTVWRIAVKTPNDMNESQQ